MAIDLTGRVFGRLTVLSRNGSTQHGRATWQCQCICGSPERVVSSAHLLNGAIASCGCLRAELHLKRATKHGHTKGGKRSRVYTAWMSMNQRTADPNYHGFEYWGGRGIKVCDRWRNSFAAFHEDMGDPPAGLSLDRKDVNGHYEKSNCRWASASEQISNRRPSSQFPKRRPPSPETRAKMRASSKARWATKPCSPETRAKMSAAHRGRKRSEHEAVL
jgi:hypothetical protein